MSIARVSPRPSIWQSPWYWLHAFCAAGLIALVLMGGKFSARQSQIERQQVRQAAPERHGDRSLQRNVAAAETELAQPETTFVTLQPLFIILTAAAIASWVI